VDRVGVKLWTRRDGVIPRLETRDRRDDNIKGNLPCSGILGSRTCFDVVSGSELKEFAKLEAALGNDDMVFLLARVQISEIFLGFGVWSEFR
jgi:hypothetical protein